MEKSNIKLVKFLIDVGLDIARNTRATDKSRNSALFTAVVPWFNFVNHNQHGVDTAKYYRAAERELEAERLGK